MAIYYIGAFPPVYGGVTIKNKNLYEALDRKLDMKKVDMNLVKRGSVREILRLGWALLNGKQFVIGLAGQKNRRVFTKLMYTFRRKAMERSIMLVMSGVVEDIIQAGPEYMGMLSTYRRIYLEFSGMARKLTDAGVKNAAVYPNGRPRPEILLPISQRQGALQCVFFSQIQPEKGVDRILDAAQILPDVQFHFYGGIVSDYQEQFLGQLAQADNVHYHGIFTGNTEAVYAELNPYDVLLLPTRCSTEGLPGILIEAKIAGLACVVSNINYNREIVEDGTDGIVLEQDTAEYLASALKMLDNDRSLLLGMKHAGRASAGLYYIDVCAADIMNELERE